MKGFWVRASTLVVLAAVATILYQLLAAAQPSAPPIPHGVAGYERCLTCHSAQGAKPVPTSHSSFDENSCLSCHSPAEVSPEQGSCVSCHGQEGLSMILPRGESLPLYINPDIFAASIHGGKLLCTDCHSSITGYPHPKIEVATRREYNIAKYDLCKRCHFANYTKTLDSVHYEIFSSGDTGAPLCTDCHGAHDVALPSQPRAKISQTCSKCHDGINDMYVTSVHGKALIEGNNYDVPVCTDCHTSHTIEDPRTAAFRLKSVDLCSSCHSSEDIMNKYGISTSVVRTYLDDFHGKTIALLSKEERDIWAEEAVCTDCHGVHDIQAVDDPESPVIKANLVNTCRSCHPGATPNFPGAWLSHYEPSLSTTPLVFLVRLFYWVLIPFIIIGLLTHVLLDLWRVITNR